MKIECVREKLLRAIIQAQKIIRKNLSLPVLNCLLFEVSSNTVIIRSTNLDVGLEITVPVKVESGGSVAVPANTLAGFVAGLYNDKSVILEVVDKNLSVVSPHSKTVIKAVDHADFPTLPQSAKEKSIKLHTKDFVNGLKAVSYSSGISHVKPELSSVYMYYDDGFVVYVATDSFRLAEKRIKMRKPKEFTPILIPFKNVLEIKKVLDESDEEMDVYIDKHQISFSFGDTYITSRLIDGIFPDYKQIMPKEFKTEVVVLKQDLISSLKLATIFSDNFNQINIEAKPSEKVFRMNTKNADVGENSNSVEAVVKGQDVEINFNYRYIVDCFQSIEADSVSLHFNGLNKPMVIQPVSDRSFTYLVMPMNK